MKRIILLIMLCFTEAISASSDVGFSAFESEDYKTAFEKLLPIAKEGNMRAQSSIGFMYYNGLGVSENKSKSAEYYEKAANQGDLLSMYLLANMYERGNGVVVNYEKAAQLIKGAANGGLPQAQNDLGFRYEYGKGVEQDYKMAILWYRKAASQGEDSAQTNLALMYHDGVGVRANRIAAYAILNLAATSNPYNRSEGSAYYYRNKIAPTLSEAELLEGQELTRKLSRENAFLQELDHYIK